MQKLRLEDFEYAELSGITHGTAHTKRAFRNPRQGSVPRFWWPKEGEVYVPAGGLGPKEVDVRSSRTGEKFTIILVF